MIRRLFCRLFLSILALFAPLISPLANSAAASFKSDYQPVRPGVEYAHLVLTNEPWSIHVARFEWARKDLRLTCTLAQDHIVGLSTVVQQVAEVPPALGRPIAAINGDFFVIKAGPYQGDPEGLQIEAGELVSGPGQDCFWLENGTPHIDEVRPRFTFRCQRGAKIPFGLNEAPRSNSIVLFTPRFGDSTRATNDCELILAPNGRTDWLPLKASHTYSALVRAVNTNGNSELTSSRMVLVFGPNEQNLASSIPVGSTLTISTDCSRNLAKAETAIGGKNILVHNGKKNQWPEEARKPASASRNPRTALGFNRRWIYLVEVDGRQKDLSVGMNFTELADLMKTVGCTEALNLDGGGSSTFWLNGTVLNSPSDKHERAVANAVVLLERP
jgi:Phosphodiester glycosidase